MGTTFTTYSTKEGTKKTYKTERQILKEKIDSDKEAFRKRIIDVQYQIKNLKSAIEDKQNKLNAYEKEESKLLSMTLAQWKKRNPQGG